MPRTLLATLALVLLAPGLAADCLTPQWTRQNIGTAGPLRIGDVAVADFDGDGEQDVAALGQTAFNQPWSGIIVSHSFAAPVTVLGGGNFVGRIFAADVNGDTRADIVVANITAKTIVTLTGRTNKTFNAPVTTTLTATPGALTMGDMNGDKKPDVVVYDTVLRNVLVLRNDGTGRFTQADQVPAPDPVQTMATGDFNRDGDLDVILGHSTNIDQMTLLFGNGDGTFGGAAAIDIGNLPEAIATGDLDGDNDTDVVTADYVGDTMTVYINDGNNGFRNGVTHSTGGSGSSMRSNPSAVVIAELTGDTKPDIAISTQNRQRAMSYTNNGNGTFRPGVTATCTTCNLSGIAAADTNGDGRRDLVTGSATLIVMKNDCGVAQVTLTPRTPTIDAGQSASFDFTVRGIGADTPTPSGTITLREGTTTLATANATSSDPMVVNGLSAGQHTLVAHYAGDADFEPAASAAVTQTVNTLATTTELTRSVATSVSGQPVTFDGVASSSGVRPTGGTTTIFIEGAPVDIENGSRATHTVTPPVATFTISARYSGDATYSASESATLTHVVTKATPVVTAAPLFAASVGQNAIFRATVTPPFFGTPTGTVRLFEGNTLLATATLDATGKALLSTAALTEGTHQLLVAYEGDTEYIATVSSQFSFTVSAHVAPRKRRAVR